MRLILQTRPWRQFLRQLGWSVALGLTLPGGPLQAHEVKHVITRSDAAIVRLSYADGEPFSFESYELYAGDVAKPHQVGRTDSQGQVVFVPEAQNRWRLRAFSADGHGVDFHFQAAARVATTVPGECVQDRLWRAVLGLVIILALCAGLRLQIRRRQTNDVQ